MTKSSPNRGASDRTVYVAFPQTVVLQRRVPFRAEALCRKPKTVSARQAESHCGERRITTTTLIRTGSNTGRAPDEFFFRKDGA
jgi:hypothetical protein